MKKYLLSFFLVIAFAFYVMLNNQISVDVGPASGAPITANTGANANSAASLPAEPTQRSAGSGATGQTEDNGSEEGGTATPAPVPAPTPATTQTPTPAPAQTAGMYKDGSYTGSVADAYYGDVQVKAIIQGGQLSDVQVLQYPSDRGTSRSINDAAMPQLVREAIKAQSANVNIVSGATQSSEAFRQSLASALAAAKA
ncbi:MAG: FMN-binding protein [Minisyncoccia bacterium]|jgi:uncharacterized protein with FMN-binding domain